MNFLANPKDCPKMIIPKGQRIFFLILIDIWQNQYNIVKLKNKIKNK